MRRGDARYRRPPARHRVLDRRRPAAVERQGRLRHPPHPAPRRALRLYLPRLYGADDLQARSRTGGADGGAVPRTEGPAVADRKGDRGGGGFVPAYAGHGHQPAGRRDRKDQGRGPGADFGQGRLRTLRYLRLPDRPDGADRPRAGRRRGPRGLRDRTAGPEGAFAQRRGRRYRRLGGAVPHQGESLHGVRYADRAGPDRPLPPRDLQRQDLLPAGLRPHAVLRQFGRSDRRHRLYRERRRAHRGRGHREGKRTDYPYRQGAARKSRGRVHGRRGRREASGRGQQPYGHAPHARGAA